MPPNRCSPRTVVTLPLRENEPPHEREVHHHLARSLAVLLGGDYDGDHDPDRPADQRRPPYFLPSTTIVGAGRARALGIRDGDDLFGGVVDRAFICTKAITHPLTTADARRPPGWSDAFAQRTRDAVLPGWTAFSLDDLREGARRLLEHGPARLKPVNATAGRGQRVIERLQDIDAALAGIDAGELADCGIVVEAHLDRVDTLSVGQVRVGSLTISYCGTQRLVDDHRGEAVYGGSSLDVVRGGFDELLARELPDASRRAIEQSRCYDRAALECFAGLYASRRNYDVAQGHDAEGRWRSGVLEQSWRVGGASAAEIGAMLALHADPALRAVRACSYEVYGDAPHCEGATVLYAGNDPELGELTKYVTIEAHGDT
ncbi:MAG: DUF3182 family protein [Burkholderiaceae bacterium]